MCAPLRKLIFLSSGAMCELSTKTALTWLRWGRMVCLPACWTSALQALCMAPGLEICNSGSLVRGSSTVRPYLLRCLQLRSKAQKEMRACWPYLAG